MGQLVETYRGEALAWEADELGHMNMRYYFARAAEARGIFCTKLHLKNMYKADGFSTLLPIKQHVKYHKELHPGHGIVVRTGITELNEDNMVLVHMISNPSQSVAGEETLSATIVETVQHISRRTQSPFPWSSAMLTVASKYQIDLPADALPRNVDLEEIGEEPSMGQADILGLPIIGQGMFQADECDAFGTVLPTCVIGRISNSVQHLTNAWPDLEFGASDQSGALLEACGRHRYFPQAGDCYVIRSGLRSVNAYTRDLCHWILDPLTGKCWTSFVGVACRFDLTTRKLVKVDEDTLAVIRKGAVQGLYP